MISIKRYLTNNPSEIEEVFRRVIQILLNAIEIHATQADEVDYADFKRTFHGIAGQFSDQTPAKEALVMAGSAAATLREYGKQTTKYIRAQNAEYHRILTMLTDAIVGISQGSERSTTRLREIEHQLERAAVIDDVRTLRVRLGECLTSIQEECEHQAREAAAMTARLTQSIAESETRVQVASPCPEEDPVTRLPGISAAERAITKLIATVPHAYVVGVIPSNIQAINSRFGHAVGDHVLQQIREELQTSLCTADRLFRWRGPCLVALLDRGPSAEEVQVEVARLLRNRIEHLAEIGTRSVLLPITLRWCIFPMNETARDTCTKIDSFVAANGSLMR